MALTRPRAHQLSETSAKAAVRVVSESNVTLSGGAPATVDGVSLTLDDTQYQPGCVIGKAL